MTLSQNVRNKRRKTVLSVRRSECARMVRMRLTVRGLKKSASAVMQSIRST